MRVEAIVRSEEEGFPRLRIVRYESEEVCEKGNPSRRLGARCTGVPGRAMGVDEIMKGV